MTKFAWIAVSAVLATPVLSTVAYSQSVDDTILSEYGQFEINSNQTKTLASGKQDRLYRICIRQRVDGVPLKVMHDGIESTIFPGDCADVEGARIDITPAERLEPGMILMGRFEHLRADS